MRNSFILHSVAFYISNSLFERFFDFAQNDIYYFVTLSERKGAKVERIIIVNDFFFCHPEQTKCVERVSRKDESLIEKTSLIEGRNALYPTFLFYIDIPFLRDFSARYARSK